MKAVIPAAGHGTRLLPATKAQPKEMLPIVDKPAIQYVVEEAVNCDIDNILIITGRGKRAIEDHFDRHIELEASLEEDKKHEYLKQIRTISDLADIHYTRQKETKGLGHAINCASKFVGDQPFLVLLGDTISMGDEPCSKELIDAYKKYKTIIIGVEKIPLELANRYGIVAGKEVSEGVLKIESLVEKPKPEEARSDLAIFGRYILTSDVFEAIDKTKPGKNGEIQLTDALASMLPEKNMYAVEVHSERYDTGSKIDWLIANIEVALKRSDLQADLIEYLEQLKLDIQKKKVKQYSA